MNSQQNPGRTQTLDICVVQSGLGHCQPANLKGNEMETASLLMTGLNAGLTQYLFYPLIEKQ